MREAIEIFKNHEAINIKDSTIEKIIWSNKDRGPFDFIKYLMDGSRLIVSGDYGVAVFEFTKLTSLKEVAKFDMYYMMKKLVCSEQPKYMMDEKKFQKDIDEWVEQYKNESESFLERVKENKREIMETYTNANSIEGYKHEISFKIYNGDINIEDDEIYSFGKVYDDSFTLMIDGLKMAVEQLVQ
jgi:hypothetical protein